MRSSAVRMPAIAVIVIAVLLPVALNHRYWSGVPPKHVLPVIAAFVAHSVWLVAYLAVVAAVGLRYRSARVLLRLAISLLSLPIAFFLASYWVLLLFELGYLLAGWSELHQYAGLLVLGRVVSRLESWFVYWFAAGYGLLLFYLFAAPLSRYSAGVKEGGGLANGAAP